MAGFLGGSAWAMAREISGGFHIVSDRTFKPLNPGQLETLAFEIDKHLREVRGDQPAIDDLPAVQLRNRKIQRLNTAMMMLRNYRQRTRR